jgi:hypothetical protein
MFDLNSNEFQGSVIFNNGQGGKVDGVTLSVDKKTAEEPDTYPAYKLVVTDATGGKINAGFYYPTLRDGMSQEDFAKREKREVGRVIHIARAVMGADAAFPSVQSSKEAFDVLFKLINDKSVGQTFNVFATYGTTGYASQYLGLRYFDFIENSNTPTGRLVAKPSDLLERIKEDSSDDGLSSVNPPATTSTESWV